MIGFMTALQPVGRVQVTRADVGIDDLRVGLLLLNLRGLASVAGAGAALHPRLVLWRATRVSAVEPLHVLFVVVPTRCE